MSEPRFPGFLLLAIAVGIILAVKALWESLLYKVENGSSKPKGKHRGFGINSQMRRRKLNLLRKDNSFKTSAIEKMTKHFNRFTGKKRR